MKTTLAAFVLTFSFALVPALWVGSSFHLGSTVPFVVGSFAVAATITAAVMLARRASWPAHLVLFTLTCGIVPFVAGGTTGLAVSALFPESAFDGVGTGLFGAAMLFPFLAIATMIAWGIALGGAWAAERVGRRSKGQLRAA